MISLMEWLSRVDFEVWQVIRQDFYYRIMMEQLGNIGYAVRGCCDLLMGA
jgi:hypothetical protein